MKQWVTIGVPKAATALFGLIKEEQPGDVDLSFTKYRIAFVSFHPWNLLRLNPSQVTHPSRRYHPRERYFLPEHALWA